MKVLYLLSIATWITVLACAEKREQKTSDAIPKKQSIDIVTIDPVDSIFAAHFALLDSVLTKKYNGLCCPPHRIQETMVFMDTTTGIPAKGDGTPFGWFYDEITIEQYRLWKDWYIKNKARLKWDEVSKIIILNKE